jgi:hypothetical protein
MAEFHVASRYAPLTPVTATDAAGRRVAVVPFRPTPEPAPVARHERTQAQRLDHVAAALLDDPHGFWRICDTNDAMSPDALADRPVLDLPERGR